MKPAEMALPFVNAASKKREHILVIDLGSRVTKAVLLLRKGDQLQLRRFALMDAPPAEKGFSVEGVTQHFKSLLQALDARVKSAVLVIGVGDSILRQTELPMMPVSDMRAMLKYSTKNYLQQDLPDHVFDCHVIASSMGSRTEGGRPSTKVKVWASGAKRQYLDDLQAAAREAGLATEYIIPGLIGPANAFEAAQAELCAREVVALVDLGFKTTTISILVKGELAFTRVVGIGGDKLTSGLAEGMNISYAEAEGIKIGMPGEVRELLQALLSPLGRELRASIDFFEHQQDRTVSQVFVSGGAGRSPFMVENLQMELMVPCQSWNPTTFLTNRLPPQQMGEIEGVAPQLAVAVGAALATG